MPLIQWTTISGCLQAFPGQAPFAILEPWLPALDSFGEATLLRIHATGRWAPFAGLPKCGPDGLAGIPYPETGLVVPDCPLGALIGRIGGSSASLKGPTAEPAMTGETKPFAIGSHCVIRLPEKAIGPLFIGFNSLSRPVLLDTLDIQFESARG